MKRSWILLLLFVGCAQPAKEKTASPAFRAMGQSVTVEASRSDEAIGFEVRRRLDLIGAADTAGIVIEVNDAIVTLRGGAPTQAAAWRAEAAARGVKDVRAVVNQIATR